MVKDSIAKELNSKLQITKSTTKSQTPSLSHCFGFAVISWLYPKFQTMHLCECNASGIELGPTPEHEPMMPKS